MINIILAGCPVVGGVGLAVAISPIAVQVADTHDHLTQWDILVNPRRRRVSESAPRESHAAPY